MNTNSELERIVSDWLEDRVVEPRHGALWAALERADQTPQQQHRWLRWWFAPGIGAIRGADPRDRFDERRDRIVSGATVAATVVAVLALVAIFGTQPNTSDPVGPADSGPTYYVAVEGGDIETIGEAVEAAEEGDTVLVAPGT